MTRDGRPHPFSRAMSRCDDVSAAMAAAEKAQRYEAFVSDVLRRDLRRVQEQRDGVFEQQAQVLQLRTSPYPASRRQLLRCTPRSTSAATSSSPQKSHPPNECFVALGYGFFAELTLPEALRHLDRRSRLP
ncbi:protein UXT isoform X2 [Falco peregrinus]|uniref:protein UXT isoform X2 n=1 Tax=Falco peregrinus TaxID=8954 RepID=UPI00247A10DB|nr:protein UXT isoform X2 [Falco peregrinus]